jgi:peptidoglycan/LPS O-acetylase OafA/YrhL
MVYDYPKIAFYLPFARFWQMSIGGLIAYKNIRIHSKTLNDTISVAGTTAILVVVWFVNEKSHFPGWWALIPTLSSAFILVAGPEAFINKHVLSTKPFVFIGKVSYPLYLWHWPLMVFSRKLFPAGSASLLGNMHFIISLSFLLSVLTYFFVENKVRFRKGKKVVIILLVIMAVLGLYAKKFIVDQDGRPLITAEEISPDLPVYETDSSYVKMLK